MATVFTPRAHVVWCPGFRRRLRDRRTALAPRRLARAEEAATLVRKVKALAMNAGPHVWTPWTGRRTAGLMLVVALAGAFVARPQVTAQVTPAPSSPGATPPFDLKDPGAVAEGRRLYHSTCTFYCHGREGRVGRGPKLRGRHLEPDYVYQRIAHGVPPMPAYQRTLSPEQLWDLVAYVLSLADATDE